MGLWRRLHEWFNLMVGRISECYNCGLIIAPYRGYDVECCGACESDYRYEEWKDAERCAIAADKVGYPYE